jgi:hypothetical protein
MPVLPVMKQSHQCPGSVHNHSEGRILMAKSMDRKKETKKPKKDKK